MNRINEAVIIVGGIGSRLFPYTKTITKEMMPIFDVPAIFLLVKEAYLSDIKTIIFVVTKKNKKLIENYFTNDSSLNEFFRNNPDKKELLKELNLIIKKMTFKYVYQTEKGNYGSVYSARKYIKNDNFIVMYGDDIMDSSIPLTKLLIDEYKKNPDMLMTVKEIPYDDLPKSGVIKVDSHDYLTGIVKKELSSNMIALGRFLLNKKIFLIKKQLPYYNNKELYLPHSLLNFKNEVKVYKFDGLYFNIGEKTGYIKASLYYALKNDLYKKEMIEFIKSLKI